MIYKTYEVQVVLKISSQCPGCTLSIFFQLKSRLMYFQSNVHDKLFQDLFSIPDVVILSFQDSSDQSPGCALSTCFFKSPF